MGRRLQSKKLRAVLYYAAKGKCVACGVDLGSDWHADHIVPWVKTKRTNVHEMQALCPKCNLNQAWKSLGYMSLDVFLLKESKFAVNTLEAILQAKNGTKLRDAVKPARPSRKKLSEEEKESGDNVTTSGRGNAIDYTLRRLARDNPELLDRIEAGELSVNAAAIKAGFRKKPTDAETCVKAWRKTESRLSVLKVIAESLEPHEWVYLMDLRTD